MVNLIEAGRVLAESVVQNPLPPEILLSPSRLSSLSQTLSTPEPSLLAGVVMQGLSFAVLIGASMEIAAVHDTGVATMDFLRRRTSFRETLLAYRNALGYAAGGLSLGAGTFAILKAVA